MRALIIGPKFHYFNLSVERAFCALGYETRVLAYDNPVHPYTLDNKIRYKLASDKLALKKESRALFHLEAELAFVRQGQTVLITPFVYKEEQYQGSITEINPTVDERGLVKVKARMRNTSDLLMDGMNVRVIVESEVRDMYVVPKEAVVERDGYHVVFMYNPATQRAVWTYVDILYSNLTHHAITGCERKRTEVHEGDIAITSGNLNLADDTSVQCAR